MLTTPPSSAPKAPPPPIRVSPPLPVTIGKEMKFAASHALAHHSGKCHRHHGHTYVLVVEVTGRVRPVDGQSDSGMVVDFSAIGTALKRLHDECLDHRDLAAFDPYPTAERLLLRIGYVLQLYLGGQLAAAEASITKLRLYEEHTFPACFAEIVPDPRLMDASCFPDTPLCKLSDWRPEVG